MVKATLDDIATKTGVSRRTVASLMTALRKADVVRLEYGGRWIPEPCCDVQGWARQAYERAHPVSLDGAARAAAGSTRAEGGVMHVQYPLTEAKYNRIRAKLEKASERRMKIREAASCWCAIWIMALGIRPFQ